MPERTNEYYQSIMRNAPFGYAYHKIMVDENDHPIDYIFLEVNAAFEGLTGLYAQNLIWRSLKEAVPVLANDSFDWISFYGKAAINGETHSFEQYSQVLERWYKVFVYSPQKYYFATIFLDISVEKKAEQVTQESQKRFEMLFRNNPALMVLLTISDQKVTDVNDTFLRVMKCEKNDVLGISLGQSVFLFDEDLPRIKELLSLKIKGGNNGEIELKLKKKDGSIFYGIANGEIVTSNDIQYLLVVLIDISDRVKIEEEKKLIEAQLLHSSRLASIGTLAAGVAHEINNPLCIIKGYADLLGSPLDKEAVNEYLNRIHIASKRIEDIVKGLRNYARPDTDHVETINVHNVIGESLTLLDSIYKKENISILISLKAESSIILGNTGKLQQVIVNLLTNAKDAILEVHKSGMIKIETTNNESHINIQVSDNGIGMNKEQMKKVFDAFYTTKAPGKGTGLGLSISNSIVQLFGGTLKVDSVKGLGTCFTVAMPLYQNAKIEKPLPIESINQSKLEGKSVLVVDDEDDIRMLLRENLECSGMKVTEAMNGELAWQAMKENKFDFVISDIKMPKMTGDVLLLKAKKNPDTASMKFILITGGIITDYTEEQRENIRNFADGYIKKPFSMDEIFKVLVELL